MRGPRIQHDVKSLEIALATYNGARYLPAQLESLFAQTCQDFDIVVGDDKSDDATLEVVAHFQSRYPGRIRVVGFAERAGTPFRNFARLSAFLRADYVSYCDQDDVWLPHKVAASLQRMRAAEARYGRACPLLVHTDMEIVDADLKRTHPSHWRHICGDPRRRALKELLLEYGAAGCALTINRALRELALPFPAEAVSHDRWLVLVAAGLGRIEYIAEPSVLYRQHPANASSRRDRGMLAFLKRASEFLDRDTLRRERAAFEGFTREAGTFLERYGPALTPAERRRLAVFAGMSRQARVRRIVDLLRSGATRTRLVSKLALLYVLLRTD